MNNAPNIQPNTNTKIQIIISFNIFNTSSHVFVNILNSPKDIPKFINAKNVPASSQKTIALVLYFIFLGS